MRQASSSPRLSKARDEQLNVRIPCELAVKLDRLVATIDREGGGRAPRKEIVAALLFDAVEDGDALVDLIARYRRASVAEISDQSP